MNEKDTNTYEGAWEKLEEIYNTWSNRRTYRTFIIIHDNPMESILMKPSKTKE